MLKKVALLSTLLLGACGGSSGNTEYSESYIQFYNLYPDIKSITMYIDDSSVNSAEYSDVTSSVSRTSGDYTIEYGYTDEFGELLKPIKKEMSLSSGYKYLHILTQDPQNQQLLEFNWERKTYKDDDDDKDQFIVKILNMTGENKEFDLHIAKKGVTFDDSTKLVTSSGQQLVDSAQVDEEEYRMFLTEQGGSEVLFQSELYDFDYSTEYVIVVRESFGPSKSDYSLDIIQNSSTVTHMSDEFSVGSFRVINATEDYPKLDISSAASGADYVLQYDDLGSFAMSEYKTVPFGDLRISVDNADSDQNLLDNFLLTLNSNESKTLVLYQNAEDAVNVLELTDKIYLGSANYEVNIINLTDQNDLDVALVKEDETSDTAEETVSNLDVFDNKALSIDKDTYDIIVSYEDDNDQKILVAEMNQVVIDTAGNYTLILTQDDATQAVTIKLNN